MQDSPNLNYFFDCSICFNPPIEPISTFCGHIFCWPCFYSSEHKKRIPKCPLCRHVTSTMNVISMKTTNDRERYLPEYIHGVSVPPRPVFFRGLLERNRHGEVEFRSFSRRKKNKFVHIVEVSRKQCVYIILCIFMLIFCIKCVFD
ncbi:hypothetical protein COBT_000031 [Conglomerata obtusa]